MRYHYKIVGKEDPTDVKADSRTVPFLKGFSTPEVATTAGNAKVEVLGLIPDTVIVEVKPVPETANEELDRVFT